MTELSKVLKKINRTVLTECNKYCTLIDWRGPGKLSKCS